MSDSQFIRKFQLIVGAPTGKTLDLSQFRCMFSVRHADLQTPNSLDITIYNVDEQTANMIKKEFTSIVINAGYEKGAFGLIFKGKIKQTRYGRENALDTYVKIIAGDGEDALSKAIVSATIGAGYSQEAVYSAIGRSMTRYDVSVEPFPPYAGQQLGPSPRGRAVFGMARDQMRTLTRTNNLAWSIQDGRLSVVEYGRQDPRAIVIELNSRSGLIGVPQQTQDGVMAKCLLNPALRPRGLIKINQKDIAEAPYSPSYSAINYFPSIAQDGLYWIVAVDFSGDTRGNEWYADLVCLAVNGTAPISQNVIGMMVTGP